MIRSYKYRGTECYKGIGYLLIVVGYWVAVLPNGSFHFFPLRDWHLFLGNKIKSALLA
jgi:hypothetical protein